MRESEKCKAPVKKMRTVASLSNSPWKSFAQTQSCPYWDWDPKTEGLSPHPWQPPWGVPRKPQEDSAHSEGSVSGPYSLGDGLQGHNPQHPPSTQTSDSRERHLQRPSPSSEVYREALSMWPLNEVTSPKCHPEGQRGLCFSQHQHTGEPHMQKRGPTHHPRGWALQETTEDLFRKARGSGQGWLAPTPGQDLQVRHKIKKVDTLLHQHPEMITSVHFSQVFSSSYCNFLKSELRNVSKLENT